MPKIYTKRGDDGCSDLYDGGRIPKSDDLFDALGTNDELSSHIGMLIALLPKHNGHFMHAELYQMLRKTQQDLQTIYSYLATPEKKHLLKQEVTEKEVKDIEKWIDTIDGTLPPLTVFILPGGSNLLESQAHVTRTICRRSERQILKTGMGNDHIHQFMNRLSDFFFCLGRFFELQGLASSL